MTRVPSAQIPATVAISAERVVPRPYRWTMDWKIELIPVPVTDVDRAKAFYQS
jgi:hypothetical protein